MPPRRQAQAPQKTTENSEDDFDLFASQQSNGSDEAQELRETLEKLYAAERAKKKELKEKKFLQVAEKQLNLDIAKPAKEVHNAMKAVETLYATFLIDYAAIEDRIYKKLDQIHKLQESQAQLVKERRQHDEEEIKKASAMHISGLSKTRTACTAFETILQRLILPHDDIEDTS